MSMRLDRHVVAGTMMLLLASASPALAQRVTTVEDLTAQQVLVQLANAVSQRPVGESIALTSAVEIATTPFLLSSGGFEFKLDPATGLVERPVRTFGPALIDRATTVGEGKVAMGATFTSVTYDRLSGMSLSNLPLASVDATTPANSRTLTGNLSLTARTVAISGILGVTDKLDVGVIVPLVGVKLAGTSTVLNGTGVIARFAETETIFGGIGDVAALAKYRVVKFEDPDLPDAGGLALVANVRLPTGDRENLRGVGVTRTLVSGLVSTARGRLRTHGTAGFEHWSAGAGVGTDLGQTVEVRHRVQYGAGLEVEAAPKLTLLLEFLGQHILSGGQVDVRPENTGPTVPGVTSAQSMVAIPDGIYKAMLVPGLKVNLKGKMLLSLNALVTLTNNGLRPRVTPAAGVFLTM